MTPKQKLEAHSAEFRREFDFSRLTVASGVVSGHRLVGRAVDVGRFLLTSGVEYLLVGIRQLHSPLRACPPSERKANGNALLANGKAAVSLDVVGIDTASRASPQSQPTVLEADAVHGRAEFAERLLRAVLAVPDSTALAKVDGRTHSVAGAPAIRR